MQKLARGATFRTLIPVEPLLIFEEAIELEYPLVLLEPLAFLLGRLLEQLCARFDARTLATQELRLCLELESSWQTEDSRQIIEHRASSPVRDNRLFNAFSFTGAAAGCQNFPQAVAA